jgi:hypothetical protein
MLDVGGVGNVSEEIKLKLYGNFRQVNVFLYVHYRVRASIEQLNLSLIMLTETVTPNFVYRQRMDLPPLKMIS